ncbi:MAG: signal peptidase II [Sedimentisphaerales bacterium]
MTELSREENSAGLNSGQACSKRRFFVLPGLKAQLIFWPLMASGLALDLASKSAVFSWLEQKPGNRVSIVDGFLQLVRIVNPGAAFGVGIGHSNLLIAVSVIALVVILVVFLLSGSQPKLVHAALGLFAAGVCGNLWDRVFNNGGVRDFIDVVYWPGRHWPAFNIADSLLCIGVALLIMANFFTGKSSRTRAQPQK